jgi:hypothetical protein
VSAARAILHGALIALVGCASAPPPTPGSSLDPERLNDGVEGMRYAFATDAPRIEGVTAAFATRVFPLPADRDRLAREGIQAAIVRAADLGEIRSRLGPITEATRFPIGQSPSWTELARRELQAGERIGVGSSVVRSEGGEARVSVRTWLVPDAEGGCAQVEVAMHLLDAGSRRAPQPGEPPDGTVAADTVLECCLQDGEALLLLPRPLPPPGKGPATGADLPPRMGALLLGEPLRKLPDGVQRGYATAIAIAARVPAAMRPDPAPRVDSEAPMGDTVRSPLGPEP